MSEWSVPHEESRNGKELEWTSERFGKCFGKDLVKFLNIIGSQQGRLIELMIYFGGTNILSSIRVVAL